MKKQTSLLILSLSTSGLVSGVVFAQDQLESVDRGPLVPDELISEPINTSEVELGIGFVLDDAYKFGRYTGLESDKAFLLGDIKYRELLEDGSFFSIRGRDLGTDSRYLRVEAGIWGSLKTFIQYDELPNFKDNTAETPYLGVGSSALQLPTGFDIYTNLDANLRGIELKTKRERVIMGANFIAQKHWQFDIDYGYESKKGLDATSAAIAHGSAQLLGNTTTSALPEPVDYDNDKVNATLHYDGDDGQFDLSYHISLFDNKNDSLSWQDPFNPTTSVGSISLAPDNEFHQLSFSGGYTLPLKSRLTGLVSLGRMTQSQDFQPYTINPDTFSLSLPRNSLDGEVWLTTVQLKLSTRAVDKLRLSAELRYNERSNQTPIDTYNYVVLDSYGGGSVTNHPHSYANNRISLNANYRFSSTSSLRGGYKHEVMKRSSDEAALEREETQEDTVFAKWKIKPTSTVDVALYAEASSRDGSEYNTLGAENPFMRKFHLADRDRTKLGASIDYVATEKLFLTARVDYNKDDYKNSVIGLFESEQPVYTVDFSYQPRENISTYGYYTYENIESTQGSYDVSTSADWDAIFNDTFNTIGIGATITDFGKWDIGVDLVYSKSRGDIEVKDLTNPGTEDQFPDNKTALSSARLWTSYDYDKQLTYKLGITYEDYSADNWAIDGLSALDPTVFETLLLGNETLDYNVYVITISGSYKY